MTIETNATANSAAQEWFLAHQEEVPKARFYAVGPQGLIGHGDDLEAVIAAVVTAGLSPKDPSLLFARNCADGSCDDGSCGV